MKKQDFIPIVLLVIVVLRAFLDSLFFKGLQFESKTRENGVIAILLLLPFLYYQPFKFKDMVSIIIMYFSLHFVFFDPMCNIFYGFKIGHVGTTSGFYDFIMHNLNFYGWFLRGIMLIFSVFWHFIAIR